MSGGERTALLPAAEESEEVTASASPGSAAHNQAIATGVMWQGALRWLSQGLAWTATIVIARRLSPGDYGIAGTAGVLVGLLSLVTDGGLARAVVMRRERDDRLLQQAHGAAIMTGVVLAVVMLALALPLASFYSEPRLAPVIAVLSIVLVLSGSNAIPQAVLQQRLQYRLLAVIDFGKTIAQGATVLVCALAGFRYWSLAIGLIVGNATALLWARRYVQVPVRRPEMVTVRPTLTYASHLIVSSLAWYLYSNSDFVMVGRVAGLAALGYYQFAWNVAQLPGEKLANVLQAVVLPFFGSIGDDKAALRHYFLILSELLVSVMLPVLVGFALVSPLAVPLIFGAKWGASIPVMQVLVMCAALNSVSMLSQHVLGATGRAAVTARLNVGALIVLPVCFLAAARFSGPLAVAGVWLLAQPFLVGIPLRKLREAIDLSLREYFSNLRAPIVSAALMAVVVFAVKSWSASVAPIVQLVLLSSLGAVTYVAAFWLMFRPRVNAIISVWRDR